MKQIIVLLFFGSIIILGSCRKDFSTEPSTGELQFSKDTIYLDTVFTDIGSSTYLLKVYNRSDADITIPSIELENGADSGYRLSVDGTPGKLFSDVDILAKDSLFIFIETTINYDEVINPLYTDKILFDTGDKQQNVDLVTLVKDAYFLYPSKTDGVVETLVVSGEETTLEGRYLNEGHPINGNEYIFTNDKPYVIYGFMMVGSETDAAKTLTIQAGAKVHFHANSGLIVGANSSLHVLGTKNIEGAEETEIIFEGDRLEPEYADVAGQWDYILFLNESTNNIINYATIKNAAIGLYVIGGNTLAPTLEINNSQLYNHSAYGLFGYATNIKGENLVINNVGASSFTSLLGGISNFTHCTFGNYFSGRSHSTPVVYLQNFVEPTDEPIVTTDLIEANFTNCIIYGNENIELGLKPSEDSSFDFNYKFTNCLIRFNDTHNDYTDNTLYDFDNTSIFENTIFNTSPNFRDAINNDMIIGADSGAIDMANPTASSLVPLDILGVDRTITSPADIGAYEHILFEE